MYPLSPVTRTRTAAPSLRPSVRALLSEVVRETRQWRQVLIHGWLRLSASPRVAPASGSTTHVTALGGHRRWRFGPRSEVSAPIAGVHGHQRRERHVGRQRLAVLLDPPQYRCATPHRAPAWSTGGSQPGLKYRRDIATKPQSVGNSKPAGLGRGPVGTKPFDWGPLLVVWLRACQSLKKSGSTGLQQPYMCSDFALHCSIMRRGLAAGDLRRSRLTRSAPGRLAGSSRKGPPRRSVARTCGGPFG
jgi:hypothetical protein